MKIKNTKMINMVDNFLNVTGIAYGVEFIETILGCIVLSLNIIMILIKLVINVRNKIRSKDIESIRDDIKETIDDLNSLKGGGKDE